MGSNLNHTAWINVQKKKRRRGKKRKKREKGRKKRRKEPKQVLRYLQENVPFLRPPHKLFNANFGSRNAVIMIFTWLSIGKSVL